MPTVLEPCKRVLPMTAYRGRLHLKGGPFSGLRYIKEKASLTKKFDREVYF